MQTLAIVLALIGSLAPFALIGLRRLCLHPTRVVCWQQQPPAPLTADELTRLSRWQRVNPLLFAVFVAFGLDAGLLTWTGVANNKAAPLLSAGFLGLALAGVAHHFSVTCPRCAMRIGLQNTLALPPACLRCGVAFRRSR